MITREQRRKFIEDLYNEGEFKDIPGARTNYKDFSTTLYRLLYDIDAERTKRNPYHLLLELIEHEDDGFAPKITKKQVDVLYAASKNGNVHVPLRVTNYLYERAGNGHAFMPDNYVSELSKIIDLIKIRNFEECQKLVNEFDDDLFCIPYFSCTEKEAQWNERAESYREIVGDEWY